MELFGFLPVDKPLGWTSHDVVARMRRIAGTRRVGHAGTLDPAATGVLVLGIGRATKFLDHVQASEKTYVAHIVLGTTSDTFDIDGRLELASSADDVPDLSAIMNCTQQFVGEIDQIPPKYSAVKQGGEPLYRRMRRGESVDAPVRTVRIDDIQVLHYHYPDLMLSVKCGSGVYIRSLAADIGEALTCGAYLHHLLRTRVGPFQLDECWSLGQLERYLGSETWTSVITATDAGIATAAAALPVNQTDAWYHGRSVRGNWMASRSTDAIRVYTGTGEFAGIGSLSFSGADQPVLQPRIVLATS